MISLKVAQIQRRMDMSWKLTLFCVAMEIVIFTKADDAGTKREDPDPEDLGVRLSPSMMRRMQDVTSTAQFIKEFVRPSSTSDAVGPPHDYPVADLPVADFPGQGDFSTVDREEEEAMRPESSMYRDILFDGDKLDPKGVEYMVANVLMDQDFCNARATTVSIPRDPDPLVKYWPNCVSISRCGGCCSDAYMGCVPTQLKLQTVEVLKLKLPNPSSEHYEYVGVRKFDLEMHDECQCEPQCELTSELCDPITQEFDSAKCRCRCRNENEATRCPVAMHWVQSECACACPRVVNFPCKEEEFFNDRTCRCEELSVLEPLKASSSSSNKASGTGCDQDCPPWQTAKLLQGECTCLPMKPRDCINIKNRRHRRRCKTQYMESRRSIPSVNKLTKL